MQVNKNHQKPSIWEVLNVEPFQPPAVAVDLSGSAGVDALDAADALGGDAHSAGGGAGTGAMAGGPAVLGGVGGQSGLYCFSMVLSRVLPWFSMVFWTLL